MLFKLSNSLTAYISNHHMIILKSLYFQRRSCVDKIKQRRQGWILDLLSKIMPYRVSFKSALPIWATSQEMSTRVGFEPTRGQHEWSAFHRLGPSATSSQLCASKTLNVWDKNFGRDFSLFYHTIERYYKLFCFFI